MKTNTIFNNILKTFFLVFILALSSCTDDDGSLSGPQTTVMSDQFDETLSFTGSNEENVSFQISVNAPNGINSITADIVLNGMFESNIYSHTNSDKNLKEFTSEDISFEILEEYIEEDLTVVVISEDLAGKIDSLELFVTALGKYETGLFIVNEGAFGNGNASLSYFDKVTSTVTNDFFYKQTNKSLGDQAQSMTIFNHKGYVIVQNSNKVEILNINNGKSIGQLTSKEGLYSPRYFLGINASKGYVSDWGADGSTGTIKVIDLTTNTVTKTISTGSGTNQLVLVGNHVFAANSGGWSNDNSVVVIDADTDEIIETITVGDNPSTLVVDEDNDVWTTGAGQTVYNADWSLNTEESTPAFLAKIDHEDFEVALKIDAPSVGMGPAGLKVDSNGSTLVFKYDGAIFSTDTETVSSTDDFTKIIETDFIYGLSIDASENHIILGIAPDYTNPGSIKRYDITGSFIDEHTVGIGPNGIAY
ncbi:YncE family protein [Reichenbachiella agariperforans]|uniref:YncE family protein n=1 Tax=Reichenbachiella agariperforans TaxID=156994 RepID=UPI001C09511F|nr:DUF5074 domain-containing protein [Reichenbachiella agariperforans]MBU2916269.1 hypothetical protein [Reichenbachiella agariperforans]